MAKKNTVVMRTDPELKKIINRIISKNYARNKKVSPARVSLAMSRQYYRYPNLLKELEEAELK